MTHNIKAGDRFRATAPNGDTFEGTAASVNGVGGAVRSKFNYFSARLYDLERLTTPLSTEVGALYGPDEVNSTIFLVRTEGLDSITSFPWYTNAHPYTWLTDEAAEELVQEQGWVRRDDRA